ncbi:Na+/H+ antiporter NhaA [uncultured Bosea sp.]|uniref:Na+/H+ antiporter NhaA n=1 Tax=uncultured Bosea sp. TaxID=211457 RepID=UPI0025DA08E1|nr:Na+/H+ antiporter NhaA [uncultured Bosea sp.]
MAAPATRTKPLSALRDFLHGEAAGGIVLMVVAALALLVANSPAAPLYFGLLKSYVLGLSVLHWINDALMAVFFLLVGLEIKREMLDGQLSSWSRRVLPGFAALGGMIAPALVYVGFNLGSPETLRGWAIPAATDIAFALGVLSLLGSRVPASLKIFLTALAILDDLGAVIIIAIFYTAELSGLCLGLAAATLAALVALNRLGVARLAPYLLLGAALWYFTLKSGVHATLAGVALALTIPLTPSPAKPDSASSPLHRLEHGLHPYVAFLIIPIFGFANAGVSFAGLGLATLGQSVPLGIMLGLFLGKQIGVFGFGWLAIRAGLADLPAKASWTQFYGIALLCGIGFTMSLFIGLLAFPASEALQDQTKIGVLAGSLLSGIGGWLLLRLAQPEDVHNQGMRETKT